MGKLTEIEIVKNDIETKLTELGLDVSNSSFLGLANIIYNFGCTEKIDFVNEKLYPVPTGDEIDSVFDKIEYLEFIKASIFNALRSKGLEVSDTEMKFSDIVSFLELANTEDRLLPLEFYTEATDNYDETKITINTSKTEESYYLYSFDKEVPVYGTTAAELSAYGWQELLDSTYTVVDPFISIAEINSDGTIIRIGSTPVITKEKITLNRVLFKSTSGSTINSTKIIDDKIYDNSYEFYYIFKTAITTLEAESYFISTYYQSDIISLSNEYIKWDRESEIKSDNNYLFFIILKENRIYGYGYIKPTIATIAPTLPFLCINSTDNEVYVNIGLYSISEGHKFIVTNNKIDPLYNEIIDVSEYTEWDGQSPIYRNISENNITIIEIDSDNKAMKYITYEIPNKKEYAAYKKFTSTSTDNNNGTIIDTLSIVTGYSYYYKESSSFEIPYFGSSIDETYKEFIPGNELFIKNNTRLIIVELDEANLIVSYDFIKVSSKVPTIEYFTFESEYGSVAGSTIITPNVSIKDNQRFFYAKGIIATAYDKEVDNWNYWNGKSEIIGFLDIESMSLVVAENDNGIYKVRKVAYGTIKHRPVELIPLSLYSRRSSTGGCTMITVTPNKDKGNIYKYRFTREMPSLYDNVSNWESWDGQSPIKSENGVDICICECTLDGLVLKTGITIVTAREPDPILENLIVVSEAGTVSGCTKISVEPSLSDGYIYAYTFRDTLPEYHEDASTWSIWNGKSEIVATNGNTICIAECTIDGFITKAGLADVVTK